MSNNISFVGRIGSDPELKEVGSSSVLEFRIANDTGFGDKKVTNWFRCAYWGKGAIGIEPYVKKGGQVFVSGELTLREYTNKEGAKGFSHDINVNKIDLVGSKGQSDEPESEMPF